MLVSCLFGLLFTIFSLATRAHPDMSDQQVCPYNRDIPITRCLRLMPPIERMSYLDFLRMGELSMKTRPEDACAKCIQAKFFDIFPSGEQRSWVERGLYTESKPVFEVSRFLEKLRFGAPLLTRAIQELKKHSFPPADFATWISTSHQEIRPYVSDSRRDSTQSVWSFLKLIFGWLKLIFVWLAVALGSLVFLVNLYDATRVERPRAED